LNVFGYNPHAIVDYLKKSTPDGKAIIPFRATHGQRSFTQQSHQRRVIGQNADLTIEGGRDDCVGIPVEHRGLG
jgi:hypothetical protein